MSPSDSQNQSQLYRQECDWAQTQPSVAVAYTIADLEERDVMELSPLYEYVDPQSLDALVSESREVTISFTAYGYLVQLTDSEVVVQST
ncbi:HalOD1 output domain-containing protein [Saliphagus infecundisoli]|uniref:HalOD1 output domain-containing protein n=1 Tax=Saliphagus infecundisoli TaxID=1849069 RepID=A0ABD5QLW7_9EURY|nr:HalOD1 output domain-containing protein [Saliphagus infecundisoli]